jgi:AraC-like DNA-binding protein
VSGLALSIPAGSIAGGSWRGGLTPGARIGQDESMPLPLDYARQVLLCRLTILEARRHRFVAGWHEATAWINSSRLIFLLDGRLRYTIQGRVVELTPGSALLVPVNTERSWVVPVQRHCDLAWFRYTCADDREPALEHGILCRDARCDLGGQAVDRLVGLLREPDPAGLIAAEAEAKALLGRFLARAESLAPPTPVQATRSRGDLAVNHAVRYLTQHSAEPGAMQDMVAGLAFSTAHFRKLFKSQMGCSPRDYLIRRRMQVARYELYHGNEQVKQVAARVGYDDPLYFSRVYAAFWGHPPTADRHRRWGGSGG